MSKYCFSCGAANANTANVCARCGKVLCSGNIEPRYKGKSSIGKIAVVLIAIAALFLLYNFIVNSRIPSLTREECKDIFFGTIQEEKNELESIYLDGKEHAPIDCDITDIEQNGNEAVVTYKLSARYKYAECDITYRCKCTYIDNSVKWREGEYEREGNWHYHDLAGVWEERDWYTSATIEFDSGPSVMSVEETEGGYRFTASENWVEQYQGEQIEINMTDLSNSIEGMYGSYRIFPKGYQWESSFQCYNLSPEEGITDMEKIA